MTSISASAMPMVQSGIATNNTSVSSGGTQTASAQLASTKSHHGHHHAGGASSSSFSALMNLLGSSDDQTGSDSDSSTDAVVSPLASLTSLTTSPATVNDIANAAPTDSAGSQESRRYAAIGGSAPAGAAIDQST